MSNTSREQILEDFMECTGLENMEECIKVLEQYQWNLLNAVQAVNERIGFSSDSSNNATVPKRSTTTKQTSVVKKPISTAYKRNPELDSNDDSDEPKIIKTLPGSSRMPKITSGATNRGTGRELSFTIEYRDQTEFLTMSENDTILQLKTSISEKIHVPPARQKLTEWTSKAYTDYTHLKDLHLPRENVIHVLSATSSMVPNGAARTSTTNRVTNHITTNRHIPNHKDQFQVTVHYEDKPGRATPYEIMLQKTATIGDLKNEFTNNVRLPMKDQQWGGLLNAKDSDSLYTFVQTHKPRLVVRKHDGRTHRQDSRPIAINRRQSDDELMEIEPDTDLRQYDSGADIIPMFSSTNTSASNTVSNRELLIPDRCTNDALGLENFTRVFHARYSSTGPILYIGTLDEAIQGSLFAPRNERRPLAIYIHNDRSVCANVFCAQVLAVDTTIEYLANNYVVWAWDVTSDANRARLFEMFKKHLGVQTIQRIRDMDKDAFPLLLIFTRTRGSIELINLIEGQNTPSEVLLALVQSHDLFEQQRQRDADEEISRENREHLKRQQEDEYHQSLQADLAKEKARLDDEKRQKDEQIANEKMKQKRLRQQEECKARLPEEPHETDKNITRMKIRLPNDEGILMRRFRINDTIQILFDYLTAQGRISGEYKLLTTFPKRDLTALNPSDTFEQLKLYPQEQLILENL